MAFNLITSSWCVWRQQCTREYVCWRHDIYNQGTTEELELFCVHCRLFFIIFFIEYQFQFCRTAYNCLIQNGLSLIFLSYFSFLFFFSNWMTLYSLSYNRSKQSCKHPGSFFLLFSRCTAVKYLYFPSFKMVWLKRESLFSDDVRIKKNHEKHATLASYFPSELPRIRWTITEYNESICVTCFLPISPPDKNSPVGARSWHAENCHEMKS